MNIKPNCLAEIYTTSELDFSVGIMVYEKNEIAVFKTVDEFGGFNGFYMIKKDIIKSVEYDTKYLKKLGLYMDYRKASGLNEIIFDASVWDKRPDMTDVISFAHENNEIITVFLKDNADDIYTGYVKEFNDKSLNMECVDTETAECFESIQLELNDIVFLEIQSPDTILLKYANQHLDA